MASADSLSVDDWIEAALTAIARAGIQAVAVNPLTRELGVTKGSFYWHFRDRGALVEAALAKWAATNTYQVIKKLDALPDPAERIRRLILKGFEDAEAGRLYATLAASSDDPLVARELARITQERVKFLERTYKGLGLKGRDAKQRAVLIVSAYAGLYHVERALSCAAAMTKADMQGYLQQLLTIALRDLPTTT